MAIQFRIIDGLEGDKFGFQLIDTLTGQILGGPFIIGPVEDSTSLLDALQSNTTTSYFEGLIAAAGADLQEIAIIHELQMNVTESWDSATQLGYDLNGTIDIGFEGDGVMSLSEIMAAPEAEETLELMADIAEIIELFPV